MNTQNNKKIKYGVVGAGHMGKYHINVLSQMVEVDLIGIYDTNRERSQEIEGEFDIKAYSSLEELTREIDAATIATPTADHYFTAKKLMNQGVHILVEKPITENMEHAEELIDLAYQKKLVLHVGHVERFNGAVQELSRIVDRPLLWESRRLGPETGRDGGMGVVLDLMIHDIDICLQTIRSPVVDISANAGYMDGASHEDMATCQLRFENKCVAVLTASRATHKKIRTLSISQKDCYIFLDFAAQDIELYRKGSSNITTSKEQISYRQESLMETIFIHKKNPLQAEVQNFIQSIEGGVSSSLHYNKLDLAALKMAMKILEIIRR